MKKRKVYELFMADEGQDHTEAWAKLELPASPYEIRDALEKAQIRPGRPACLEIQRYLPGVEWLKPFVAPTGRSVRIQRAGGETRRHGCVGTAQL